MPFKSPVVPVAATTVQLVSARNVPTYERACEVRKSLLAMGYAIAHCRPYLMEGLELWAVDGCKTTYEELAV